MRKNPVTGLDLSKFLSQSAGNLLVTASLQGATFEEKALIASLIPSVLKVIRTIPHEDLDSFITKTFPKGIEVDVHGIRIVRHESHESHTDAPGPSPAKTSQPSPAEE